MAARTVIRKNQYYDSVFLMRVAKTLLEEPGVKESAVLMATEANKELLAELGFNSPEVMSATANDLVIGIQSNDVTLMRLLGEMDVRLKSQPGMVRHLPICQMPVQLIHSLTWWLSRCLGHMLPGKRARRWNSESMYSCSAIMSPWMRKWRSSSWQKLAAVW
jgi:hypothetical protein